MQQGWVDLQDLMILYNAVLHTGACLPMCSTTLGKIIQPCRSTQAFLHLEAAVQQLQLA